MENFVDPEKSATVLLKVQCFPSNSESREMAEVFILSMLVTLMTFHRLHSVAMAHTLTC